MLLSPRKNGLTSLFKEVRVFKDPYFRQASRDILGQKIHRRTEPTPQSWPTEKRLPTLAAVQVSKDSVHLAAQEAASMIDGSMPWFVAHDWQPEEGLA